MKFITHQLRWLLPVVVALPLAIMMSSWWGRGLFGGGLILGMVIMWLDEVKLWVWYQEPDQQHDLATELASMGRKLVTRSPLFLTVFIPLSIFVMTSTGSPIGMGLVLAIALILAVEMWQSRKNVPFFQYRFGQQTTHHFTALEVERITVAAWVFIGVLIILALT